MSMGKRASPAQKRVRTAMSRASKSCKGKKGKSFSSCRNAAFKKFYKG